MCNIEQRRGPFWSIEEKYPTADLETVTEAESLRRSAERALRLARAIPDDRTVQALTMHAADLHTKAEWLERQDMPPQQPSPGQQQPAQQQQAE